MVNEGSKVPTNAVSPTTPVISPLSGMNDGVVCFNKLKESLSLQSSAAQEFGTGTKVMPPGDLTPISKVTNKDILSQLDKKRNLFVEIPKTSAPGLGTSHFSYNKQIAQHMTAGEYSKLIQSLPATIKNVEQLNATLLSMNNAGAANQGSKFSLARVSSVATAVLLVQELLCCLNDKEIVKCVLTDIKIYNSDDVLKMNTPPINKDKVPWQIKNTLLTRETGGAN